MNWKQSGCQPNWRIVNRKHLIGSHWFPVSNAPRNTRGPKHHMRPSCPSAAANSTNTYIGLCYTCRLQLASSASAKQGGVHIYSAAVILPYARSTNMHRISPHITTLHPKPVKPRGPYGNTSCCDGQVALGLGGNKAPPQKKQPAAEPHA